MDDKNDPYNRLYPAPKPALPPFSSLRPRTSAPEAGHGSPSDSSAGYRASLDAYHHPQQYTYTSSSPYLQNSSPHFIQQSPSQGSQFQNTPREGPARGNQPSQLNLCPSSSSTTSSFCGSLAVDSQFSTNDHPQLAGCLQLPPIPDMSLSLPFSASHPGFIGSSGLPIDESFTTTGCFTSSIDHRPQALMNQSAPFVSQAGLKPYSDFNTLPPTSESYDINSSGQSSSSSSFTSVPCQQSEHLPSFSNFSSFSSKTSGMKEMCVNSGLENNAGGTNSHYARFCVQENRGGSIHAAGSLAGYRACGTNESAVHPPPSPPDYPTFGTGGPAFTSQYPSSGDVYSENSFLAKKEFAHSLGVPISGYGQFEGQFCEPKQMFGTTVKSNVASSSFMMDESVPFRTATKPNQRGKKKTKSDEGVQSTGTKTGARKTKAKRKPKSHSSREMSSEMPDVNNDSDGTPSSPAVCLSPTFIASLSSKRAPDPPFPPAFSHTSPCDSKQGVPQARHSIPDQISNHQLPLNHNNYMGLSAVSLNPATVSTQCTESRTTLFSGNASHMSYSHSTSRIHDSHLGSGMFQQSSDQTHPHSSHPDSRNYTVHPRDSSTAKTNDEERTLPPFQLATMFQQGTPSTKAEYSPQFGLNNTVSGISNSLMSRNQAPAHFVPPSISVSENQRGFLAQISDSPYREAFITPESQILNSPMTLQTHDVRTTSVDHEHGLINSCSPTTSVSLPSYPEGSEFQYPTPPMEDDENKLHSPGSQLHPAFLDSMSRKMTPTELTNELSPIHDDPAYALPTPPNSAGPKQPSAPEIGLSKEEQTSRILEIIARERAKSMGTLQTPASEPKKKKQRRKIKSSGNSRDDFEITDMLVPRQVDQNPQFVSDFLAADSVPATSFNTYQNYSEKSPEQLVTNSASGHANSFVKFIDKTRISNDKLDQLPTDYQQQHKQVQRLNTKHERSISKWINSDCGEDTETCKQNQRFQSFENIHEFEDEKHKNQSEGFDMVTFRSGHVGTQECLVTGSNCSLPKSHLTCDPHYGDRKPQPAPQVFDTKPQPMHAQQKFDTKLQSMYAPQIFDTKSHLPQAPQIFDTKPIKSDPYAFDDSEHRDVSISAMRNLKPVHKLHLQSGPETPSMAPTTYSPDNTETYSEQTVGRRNQKTTNDHHILQNNSSSGGDVKNKMTQPDKMLMANTLGSEGSHLQYNQSNFRQQPGNLQNSRSMSSTDTSTLVCGQFLQGKSDVCFPNTQNPPFSSSDSFIKQEFEDLSQSVHHIGDSHLPQHNPFNGHVYGEPSVSEACGTSRKKRGRPPKGSSSSSSTSSSPAKAKTPRTKAQESKPKIQAARKVTCKLNGAEVKCEGLNINPDLADRLAKNLVEVADCSCLGPDYVSSEATEGPYYTQLGAARDIPGVRRVMEQRTGLSGSAIRIEKVIFTGKEGKSKEGCPVAKWIIRRSGPEEKYLCIARKRPGHFCDNAVIIISIVAWEGVKLEQADMLYDFLITTLPQNGIETDRRCGLNEKKTCACQGVDLLRRGASFSFGCSWSMYYNGCKFARSQAARKFKLKDPDCEEELEDRLQKLATDVAPLYRRLAPDAFRNQIQFESKAVDCRLGHCPGRPFSGVTAVVDFCCHSHRDCHNMNNGCTVVVNLTKHRGYDKPEDEQFHVLPLYILDQTDELGSMEGQMAKINGGSLEVLSRYMSQVRLRSTPYRPCKRNRTNTNVKGNKRGPKKMKLMKSKSFPPSSYSGEASLQNGGDSFRQDGFVLPQSPVNNNIHSVTAHGVGVEGRNQESMSYSELMSQQGTPGFGDLYTKFWDFFYTHGEFPPREWTSGKVCPAPSKPTGVAVTVQAGVDLVGLQQQHHRQQEKQRQQLQGQVADQQQWQQIFDIKNGNFQPLSPHSSVSSPRQQQQHSHIHHQTSSTNTSPSSTPSSTCSLPSSSAAKQHTIQTSHLHGPPSQSSPLQQANLPEPHSFSNHFHFSNNSSKTDMSESDSNKMSTASAHETNNSVILHSTSQNHPHQYQNATTSSAAAYDVQTGDSADHVRCPPPYRQSSNNQHNIPCSLQETACSTKPQGPPPSYSESLAQNNNNIQFNDTQEGIYTPKFSPTHPFSGQHLSQSSQFSSVYNCSNQRPSSLTYPMEGSSGQQRSGSSHSQEESRALPSQSVSESSMVQPLGQQNSVHQHQSLSLAPNPASTHFLERPPLTQSRSTFMELSSCPESVEPGYLSLAQATNRSPVSILPSMNRLMNVHITPELHSQSLERDQPCQSVDGKQHFVQGQSPAAVEPSLPHSFTTSGPWCINRQQGLQQNPARTDSETDHVDQNSCSQKYLSGTSETDISNNSKFVFDDKQTKVMAERCWSRMSEPGTGNETPRPSSCSSEPGASGGRCRRDVFNPAVMDILSNRINFEMHQSSQKVGFKDKEYLGNQRSMSIDSYSASRLGNNLSETSKSGGGLPSLKSFKPNSSGEPARHANNVANQFGRNMPNEAFCNGMFVNEPMGSVCPNGPVAREMMKVHKTEGYVVRKSDHRPSEPPYEVIDSTVVSVETDDNREVFEDPAMGGVAISLCHGAVLFEVAKRELHATTALKEPNRYQPKRISLVFYQHKNLNLSRHGFDEYERKAEERRSQAEQARLVEEMECKGIVKDELKDLAAFPNLTKGTFGNVFNFPESREPLFPLRFPRYLDSSHLEHISPVMFACMSIAFPKYMKEAFPDPSKLPRLMSGHMPIRMHSSLSDKRNIKPEDSEAEETELKDLLNNKHEESQSVLHKDLGTWNPNVPQGDSVTTNSVITRWMSDDVSVTGPYNQWVGLAQKMVLYRDGENPEEMGSKYEDILDEKVHLAASDFEHVGCNIANHMNSESFKYAELNTMIARENSDAASVSSTVVTLEPDLSKSQVEDTYLVGRAVAEVSLREEVLVKLELKTAGGEPSGLVDTAVGRADVAGLAQSEIEHMRQNSAFHLDKFGDNGTAHEKNETTGTALEDREAGVCVPLGDRKAAFDGHQQPSI